MVASDPGAVLSIAANLLTIAFFAFTIGVLLSFLIRSERVTEDVLYGAVAIYMLLGGLWFSLYVLIELTSPGSFLDTTLGGGQPADWTELLYYSFVTLTTLGHGDIVPVTLVAKHVTVAEAIVGVMYLAIVMSRLVGLFIAQSREHAGRFEA